MSSGKEGQKGPKLFKPTRIQPLPEGGSISSRPTPPAEPQPQSSEYPSQRQRPVPSEQGVTGSLDSADTPEKLRDAVGDLRKRMETERKIEKITGEYPALPNKRRLYPHTEGDQ